MTKDGWDATVENFTYEASEVDVYNNAPTPKAINVSKKQQWQKVVIVFWELHHITVRLYVRQNEIRKLKLQYFSNGVKPLFPEL